MRLFTKEGSITIEASKDPDHIRLIIEDRGYRLHTITEIKTRELVLAIKEIEEERDAKYPSAKATSPESWSYDHRILLERTILGAEAELRDMFRKIGPGYLHDEKTIRLLRALGEAKSAAEATDIYHRIKEIYLSPGCLPPRCF